MVAAARMTTCQCPPKASGAGMMRVSAQKRKEFRDGNGNLVAVVCGACTLPIALVCRACQEQVKSIDEHVKVSPACADDLAYRTARAPSPSLRVTKAALKLTGKLFPDEVLDPIKGSKAFHK
jgi:hypothetical protein